jgi:demethylmenaquinone methyltransferase/2-methoxy-6-polyprenyl-1,4-benzoquinol methylase
VNDTVSYYARRAQEYDRVYSLPPWQRDLRRLEARVSRAFAGRRVFETACGTGYWTRHIAQSAAEVYAIDVNETALELARSREYGTAAVRFEQRDAYLAFSAAPRFDGGYAGLWLSHVDLSRMDAFLHAFHSYLLPGATVIMTDERQSEGRRRRLPASRTDAAGNRYELRRLESGEEFEAFFRQPPPVAADLVYEELQYFWMVTYRRQG